VRAARLRDLVGENLAGSVQLQFSDVLKHWEARFHASRSKTGTAAIAERRVLRPVDDAARQTLQATFDDVMKIRKDVLDTLLTTTSTGRCSQVYPSARHGPDADRGLSGAAARAHPLKLMLKLLVTAEPTSSSAS